jgi:hypothetical protein
MSRIFSSAEPGPQLTWTAMIANDISVGLKWKPLEKRNLLVYANGLFQVNNVGMRSDPVPLVGLSYTFGF